MVSWMKGMHTRLESNIRFHRRSQGQLPFLRRFHTASEYFFATGPMVFHSF